MYKKLHAISIAPPETVGYNTPTQRKTQRCLFLGRNMCRDAIYCLYLRGRDTSRPYNVRLALPLCLLL